ncbi:helicase associated protein [Pontibacter ummariensis]|uniref:Helicase associated domain-containing protein n=1 Tax=Pontibacter ummariensis TaxID=1610492 RepID=A0A239LSX8_9BACT|nr:helicase associated domain-containing protein [Pontibacter ummariensis]PRY01205.1 helicase associated protein [Pontibacter ummariensis]SNT33787.1 Helicase associated domain-containing protein [Pontibacter ummariensis]
MEHLEKGIFNKEFFSLWYSNYHRLEAMNGTVGDTADELDEELESWIGIQRNIRHMLPCELKAKLSALSLDFEDKGLSWELMYRQLADFVQNKGHACLPSDHKHEALKDWLIRQVLSKGLLSAIQFQRLDSLGVDWEMAISRDHRWNQMLWRLKEFKQTFGHCRVPQKWVKDKQLAHWVTVQRRTYSQNRIREDRQRLLSELGFIWSIKSRQEAQWEEFFLQLITFRQKHGHCRVPGKKGKLASWVERQRTARTNGRLRPEREKRLDEIGFTWNFEHIRKRNWEERYRQLRAYKQQYGHCFVPANCRENKTLGVWVVSQRWLESKGKLSADKLEKLNELGFVWSKDTQDQLKAVYDTQWEASFEKLKAYRQAHGTYQVSLKINAVLQRWTSWQRMLFYEEKLSADRIDKLNKIGFPWSVQKEYWMKMYNALVDYRKRFGHTRVPFQWAPNPQLSAWSYKVRLNKAELDSQKVKLLDRIGFDWTLRRKKVVPWKEMYKRLVAFKQEHGHTRVPACWKKDPKLGKWVSRMRQEREKLTPGRVALLETIAFEWNLRTLSRPSTKGHRAQAFGHTVAS